MSAKKSLAYHIHHQSTMNNRLLLIKFSIILIFLLSSIELVRSFQIDFSSVWFQHTNQILHIYDQLSQYQTEPVDLVINHDDDHHNSHLTWNETNHCRISMQKLVHDANEGKFYANKMIDSIGRPTSGILEGRLTYLGQYDECLASSGPSFRGKYCIAHIQLPSNFSYLLSNISGLNGKLGVCLPSTCSTEDVSQIAHKFSSMFKPALSVKVIECIENNDSLAENLDLFSLTLFGGICSLLFVLVLIGTVYEHLTFDSSCCSQSHFMLNKNVEESIVDYKPIPNSFTKQMVLAFSIKENIKKIFDLRQKNDAISIFHGIKFLAMIWIIFTHSISFSSQWINFNNPLDIKRTAHNIFSQILVNGTFSVDCFFFISGYLVVHSLKRLKVHNSKFNVILFYVNRYIRMTPTMMFVIGFGATMLRYFGSGPEWTNSTVMFDLWCRKNWWINAIYLQNFIDTDNMCLAHSWYSSVDTQFFVISPLIILFLYRKPSIGVSLCLMMLVGSSGITWVLTILNNYPAVPYFNDIIPLDVINSYYQNIYIKPYCRIGPYIVGMLLAFTMNQTKSNIKLSKPFLFTGWSFTLVSTVGVIVAMLPANNGHIPDVHIAALYSSTSRIMWSLGLSWITFVSLQNYGGIVTSFLTLKVWVPLSRLTYCAYLVHPIIIALFYGSRHQTFDYSFYLILYFSISNICITYVVSFLMALFIEYPIISIGKLFLKKI